MSFSSKALGYDGCILHISIFLIYCPVPSPTDINKKENNNFNLEGEKDNIIENLDF